MLILIFSPAIIKRGYVDRELNIHAYTPTIAYYYQPHSQSIDAKIQFIFLPCFLHIQQQLLILLNWFHILFWYLLGEGTFLILQILNSIEQLVDEVQELLSVHIVELLACLAKGYGGNLI